MNQSSATVESTFLDVRIDSLLVSASLITILTGGFTWFFGFELLTLVLMASGTAGILLLLVSKPWYILQLLLIFLPVSYVVSGFVEGALGLLVKEGLFAFLILSWFMRSLLMGNLRLQNTLFGKTQILLLAWVGLLILDAVRQPPLVGFFGFRSIALYSPLVFLVPSVLDDKVKLRGVLNTLTMVGVAIAVVAVAQYIFLDDMMNLMRIEYGELGYRTTMGKLKASSTLGDPGAAGALIGVLLSLFFSYTYYNTGMKEAILKYRSVLALAVMFIGLVLTLSRSAWISCFAGFVVWSYLNKRIAKRVVIVCIFFITTLNFAFDNFVLNNFLSVVGFGSNVKGIESRDNRIEIISNTFDRYISESPLFGHGLGITGAPSMRNADFLRDRYVLMDNYYLKLLVETGFVGTLLFLIILLSCIFVSIKQFRNLRDKELARISLGIGIALCVIFFISFTLSVLENPVINIYFWLLIGLLYTCKALNHR